MVTSFVSKDTRRNDLHDMKYEYVQGEGCGSLICAICGGDHGWTARVNNQVATHCRFFVLPPQLSTTLDFKSCFGAINTSTEYATRSEVRHARVWPIVITVRMRGQVLK